MCTLKLRTEPQTQCCSSLSGKFRMVKYLMKWSRWFPHWTGNCQLTSDILQLTYSCICHQLAVWPSQCPRVAPHTVPYRSVCIARWRPGLQVQVPSKEAPFKGMYKEHPIYLISSLQHLFMHCSKHFSLFIGYTMYLYLILLFKQKIVCMLQHNCHLQQSFNSHALTSIIFHTGCNTFLLQYLHPLDELHHNNPILCMIFMQSHPSGWFINTNPQMLLMTQQPSPRRVT